MATTRGLGDHGFAFVSCAADKPAPPSLIDEIKHKFPPKMLTAAAAIFGMIAIKHHLFWG